MFLSKTIKLFVKHDHQQDVLFDCQLYATFGFSTSFLSISEQWNFSDLIASEIIARDNYSQNTLHLRRRKYKLLNYFIHYSGLIQNNLVKFYRFNTKMSAKCGIRRKL